MARASVGKDYYAALGLPTEATEDQIRMAYRRLALQWHPDRNADPAAAERFREVSEAYAVLIDASKRREYDRERRAGRAPRFDQHRREDLFRDLFSNASAAVVFEDLAREFAQLGLSVDARYFRQTLLGGRAVVTGGFVIISPLSPLRALGTGLRAALRGTRAAPSLDALHTTPSRGSQIMAALGRGTRWLLGAPGTVRPTPAPDPADIVLPFRLTRAEAERGSRKPVRLEGGGAGEILVTVPPGTRAGTRLRLRGQGRPGAGGTRGDAYLAVEITD